MQFRKKFITSNSEAVELRLRYIDEGNMKGSFEVEIYRQSSLVAYTMSKDIVYDPIVKTSDKEDLKKTAHEIIDKLTRAITKKENE